LVMRPRLTDAASVANDVEDPDLPYIPEVTLPPNIPIPQPPTDIPVDPDDPGGCLYNVDAIPNGPFELLLYPTSVQSNQGYYVDFPCPGVWARPAGFTNLSKVAITGDWLKWDAVSSNWIGSTLDTNWNVYMNGIDLTKEPHTDNGTGTRIVTSTLGGMQAMINLRLQLDPTDPGQFTVGSSVTSGTVAANDSVGVAVTLVPGQYYSIEGTGGPWIAGAAVSANIWAVGFTTARDEVDVGYNENTSDWRDRGAMAYVHLTANQYGRAFFRARDSVIYVRVQDTDYGDNTGTMGYIIRNATYSEFYKWNIRGVSLYNICSA
jgi:hypothetical protein